MHIDSASRFLSLIAGLSILTGAFAQTARPVSPLLPYAVRNASGTMTFGDMAMGAVQAASEGGELKRDFEEQIEQARSQFWEAYRSGDDYEQEAADLGQLLLQKDMVYFVYALPEGSLYGRGGVVMMLTGGQMDEGIKPQAHDAFLAWVSDVREHLGIPKGKMPSRAAMNRVAAALTECEDSFARYARLRTMAEFQRKRQTYPGFSDADWFVISHLVGRQIKRNDFGILYVEAFPRQQDRLDPYAGAEQSLNSMREIFGHEAVDSIIERVRAWTLIPYPGEPLPAPNTVGDLVAKQSGESLETIYHHLAGNGPREYLLWSIVHFHTKNRERLYRSADWRQAVRTVDRMNALYGEKNVLAAALRIEQTPKVVEMDAPFRLQKRPYFYVQRNDELLPDFSRLDDGKGRIHPFDAIHALASEASGQPINLNIRVDFPDPPASNTSGAPAPESSPDASGTRSKSRTRTPRDD